MTSPSVRRPDDLDVGCDPGTVTGYLAERGWTSAVSTSPREQAGLTPTAELRLPADEQLRIGPGVVLAARRDG